MKIRQDFIVEQLRLWRLARGEQARNAILREVSPFIWHFPGFVFRVDDEDRRSDFYLAVLARFDRILARYDETRHPFSTWLAACLRNAWLNFVTRNRQPEFDSLDRLEEVSGAGAIATAPEPEPAAGLSDGGNTEPGYRSPQERLAWRLYHLDLFSADDFELLLEVSGAPLSACAAFLEEQYETVRKKRARQAALDRKLATIYHELLRRQRELHALQAQSDPDEQRERLCREQEHRLRQRQQHALFAYRRLRVHPPAARLAAFLGMSPDHFHHLLRSVQRHNRPSSYPPGALP